MSEQELHIHTHTGSDGIAHIRDLDIPVGIANQDIDITISYSAIKAKQKAKRIPGIDKGRFVIPDNLDSQDIDMVVSGSTSINSEPEDDAELEKLLAEAKPAIDMSEYCGVIQLKEDPLEYQRRIRDEW